MAFVRTQPCTAILIGCSCSLSTPTEAHHMGPRGISQKADDTTCVPLSTACHRAWHDCTGPFAGWTREQRADFGARAIAETRAAYPRSTQRFAIAF
jgi:hypothetical protein